ncbi:MAG: methylated-DNA--[protein]-cysteine S-methyltransferase [Chloroflexota bacterium]|nr:methylated-DNA--[protein]-cysteine S-methyltransferase [Chloroflexota bacterium]
MSQCDAAYIILPAPWGPIHVAASDDAIVALELHTETARFVGGLEGRLRAVVEPRPSRGPRRDLLDQAATELEAYLRGDRRTFDLPLDLGQSRDWDRAVLGGVRLVPWGRVTSYGRLARRIGRTGAARAVGGAVGRNPIGLLIPCHRVIAGDGTLGGYGGEWWGTRESMLGLKRTLLDIEGVELPTSRFFD